MLVAMGRYLLIVSGVLVTPRLREAAGRLSVVGLRFLVLGDVAPERCPGVRD
jgi:hypothetical protein